MPSIQTEKDLPENSRQLWLKALHAVELKNYGYAISLIQAILKESPGFLDGRRRLRKVEILATKGKKSFLSGLSTASLKGAGMIKKDPLAAMELAEKNLETDPTNTQINHLLKEAAKAAGYPEIAALALETIVEANPTDTKVMHELGEHYIAMNRPDDAVELYGKIVAINPADLTAVKRSKDAAATASMKSGGWTEAKSFRDLIKNKEEAISLEQKSRVVKSLDMVEEQIGELTTQLDAEPQNVDLTRRVAILWENRFEHKQDVESLDGTVYYYTQLDTLVGGADPGVTRKLTTLNLQRLDLHIKEIEDWFTQGGDQHVTVEEADAYRHQLADLKRQKAEQLVGDAKRRVERNPTDLQLRFELGEQLVKAGVYTEAIQELQRAKQNPNARLKAMNLLGQCYTEKNMLDLAVKQFQECASEIVAMDVTKKEVLYSLGLVFERMGKKDDALKCMKDIYEVDYGYRDVAQRVEQSYGG
jgi:tetratricopeptide (TPR) repeat protein